jgi:hypothetical protein
MGPLFFAIALLLVKLFRMFETDELSSGRFSLAGATESPQGAPFDPAG